MKKIAFIDCDQYAEFGNSQLVIDSITHWNEVDDETFDLLVKAKNYGLLEGIKILVHRTGFEFESIVKTALERVKPYEEREKKKREQEEKNRIARENRKQTSDLERKRKRLEKLKKELGE